MAVRKPRPTSKTWWTKFRVGGRAVEIDTSEAERAAQRIEDQLKAEMKVAHKAGKRVVIAEAPAAAPALTFGAAVSEYIDRVVSLHESQMHRCNTGWSLEWLVREIGAERPLFQIDNRLVSDVVARRRGERGRHGQLLSRTTINRSVTEPLRKVLRHAARLNELSLKIDWNLHLLDEPEEIVRELQTGEEERLFAADAMRADYEPALRIALLLGLRAGEILRMTWADVTSATAGSRFMPSAKPASCLLSPRCVRSFFRCRPIIHTSFSHMRPSAHATAVSVASDCR